MAESAGLGLVNLETNDLTQFTSYSIGSGDTFAVQAAALLHGSYGLRYASVSAPSNSSYGIKTFTPQTLVYARCYLKFSSDLTLGGSIYNQIGFMILQDSSNRDLCAFAICPEDGVNPTMSISYYATNANLGNGVGDLSEMANKNRVIYYDTLYYIDMYYSYAAGTGTAGIYINGTLYNSVSGLTNNNCIPSQIKIGGVPSYSCYLTAGYVDFDDIKISTSLIGAYADAGEAIPVWGIRM
jgi:hypothetical protein